MYGVELSGSLILFCFRTNRWEVGVAFLVETVENLFRFVSFTVPNG